MKLRITALMVLFHIVVISQPVPQSPNKTNKVGQREGRWTILLSQAEAEIKDLESAMYYRLVTYDKGKPVGVVRDYYRSGKISTEGLYLSLDPIVREGKFIKFFENGNKQLESTYVNNIAQGELIMYYESNGHVMGRGPVKNDSLNGVFTWYYETGKIKMRGMMQNNQFNGAFTTYHPNENVSGEMQYVQGAANGPAAFYNRKGVKMAEGSYQNNVQLRDWKFIGDDWETLIAKANYESVQNTSLAAVYFKQGLDQIEKELGTKNDYYLGTAIVYGRMLITNTEFQAAEEFHLKLKNIFAEAYPVPNINHAIIDNALGLCRESKGQYGDAENFYKSALETMRHGGLELSPTGLAIQTNLARLNYHRNQLTKAQEELEVLKNVFEQLGYTRDPNFQLVLENLANIYRDNDEYDKAEKLFELCLTQYAFDPTSYTQFSLGLALTLFGQKKLSRANAVIQQATPTIQNLYGKDSGFEARLLLIQSLIEFKMDKLGESKAHLEKTIEIYKKLYGDRNSELGYLNIMYGTLIAGRLNDPVTAHPYFQAMSKIFYQQLTQEFPYLTEKEKAGFYSRFIKYFDEYFCFTLLYAKNSPAWLSEALDTRLATKGFLINSSSKWKQRILNSGDTKLINQFLSWQEKKEKLLRYYKLPTDQFEGMKPAVDSLENVLSKMEKELSTRSEFFGNLFEKAAPTWKNVQATLQKGDAAVEIIRVPTYGRKGTITDSSDVALPQYPNYGLTDSIVYAALVVTPTTRDYPQLVLLPDGNRLEKQYLKFYRNSIQFKQTDRDSYSRYWESIKAQLKGVKRVYLSPDGIYHQVNMNSLFNPKTKKYAIDEMEIRLVTSLGDLVKPRPTDKQSNVAMLIGNPDFLAGIDPTLPDDKLRERSMAHVPLPGSEKEIEQIEIKLKQSGWKTELLKGYEASEEALKKSYKPRLLHIATHGFFQADDRADASEQLGNAMDQNRSGVVENELLKSGLIMAGAASGTASGIDGSIAFEAAEDGYLTAYEAMNLNLDNTDLVVLSACETGLGEIKNGEGVYGLQRAFQVAGANNLIMSLWKVNDEATNLLMNEFYKQWLSGQSKFESFRKAQIILRETHPEPYFWAPFVLVGR